MLSTVRSPVVLTTLARGQVQERLWGLLLKGKGRFLGRLQTRRGARCPPNLWDSAGIMEGQNLLLQRPSVRKHRADSPRSGESISPDGEPALKLRVSWRWEAEGSQRQVSSSNSRKPKTEDPGSGPGGGGGTWGFFASNWGCISTPALNCNRNGGHWFLDFCDKQGGANLKRSSKLL